MLLVTGGWSQQSFNLFTTEVKVADSGNWKTAVAGAVPSSSPLALVAMSLNGDSFLTGKVTERKQELQTFLSVDFNCKPRKLHTGNDIRTEGA